MAMRNTNAGSLAATKTEMRFQWLGRSSCQKCPHSRRMCWIVGSCKIQLTVVHDWRGISQEPTKVLRGLACGRQKSNAKFHGLDLFSKVGTDHLCRLVIPKSNDSQYMVWGVFLKTYSCPQHVLARVKSPKVHGIHSMAGESLLKRLMRSRRYAELRSPNRNRIVPRL